MKIPSTSTRPVANHLSNEEDNGNGSTGVVRRDKPSLPPVVASGALNTITSTIGTNDVFSVLLEEENREVPTHRGCHGILPSTKCNHGANPMEESTVPMTYNNGTLLLPLKLHLILDEAERLGHNDIVSWMPCGTAFKIHDKGEFAAKVLPVHFATCIYKSFQRSLNLWGFQTHSAGPNVGARYHPLFRRDKPYLCNGMKRVRVKRINESKQGSCPTRSIHKADEDEGPAAPVGTPRSRTMNENVLKSLLQAWMLPHHLSSTLDIPLLQGKSLSNLSFALDASSNLAAPLHAGARRRPEPASTTVDTAVKPAMESLSAMPSQCTCFCSSPLQSQQLDSISSRERKEHFHHITPLPANKPSFLLSCSACPMRRRRNMRSEESRSSSTTNQEGAAWSPPSSLPVLPISSRTSAAEFIPPPVLPSSLLESVWYRRVLVGVIANSSVGLEQQQLEVAAAAARRTAAIRPTSTNNTSLALWMQRRQGTSTSRASGSGYTF